MQIRDIFIHPLKSAAGIRVSVAQLDACGLVDDRRGMDLVVSTSVPHIEDEWTTIAIGDGDVVHLNVVKPCARCSIVPVDQATGIRGIEPLRTLATYRRRDGKVLFGQNAIHRALGTIRVGDPALRRRLIRVRDDLAGVRTPPASRRSPAA